MYMYMYQKCDCALYVLNTVCWRQLHGKLGRMGGRDGMRTMGGGSCDDCDVMGNRMALAERGAAPGIT